MLAAAQLNRKILIIEDKRVLNARVPLGVWTRIQHQIHDKPDASDRHIEGCERVIHQGDSAEEPYEIEHNRSLAPQTRTQGGRFDQRPGPDNEAKERQCPSNLAGPRSCVHRGCYGAKAHEHSHKCAKRHQQCSIGAQIGHVEHRARVRPAFRNCGCSPYHDTLIPAMAGRGSGGKSGLGATPRLRAILHPWPHPRADHADRIGPLPAVVTRGPKTFPPEKEYAP